MDVGDPERDRDGLMVVLEVDEPADEAFDRPRSGASAVAVPGISPPPVPSFSRSSGSRAKSGSRIGAHLLHAEPADRRLVGDGAPSGRAHEVAEGPHRALAAGPPVAERPGRLVKRAVDARVELAEDGRRPRAPPDVGEELLHVRRRDRLEGPGAPGREDVPFHQAAVSLDGLRPEARGRHHVLEERPEGLPGTAGIGEESAPRRPLGLGEPAPSVVGSAELLRDELPVRVRKPAR